LNCFNKLGIYFENSVELNSHSNKTLLKNFPKEERVYFLMGGNPINQIDVINKYQLIDVLKNTEDFVIGFLG